MASQRAFVLISCLAAAMAAGCRPQLPPDPDAVLYYFRDARVQGEVKRVWPEGQQYVDNVLAADAQLQVALKPLLAWQTPESLWPREDPRWQDPNELQNQIDALTKVVRDTVEKREKACADLQAAIAAVPMSLELARADAATFVDKVWQALALDGPGLGLDVRKASAQYTATAQAHLDLLTAVRSSAADLDPNASGLRLKDGARQESLDNTYAGLAARLEQNRGQFLQYAERELLASRGGNASGAQERYLGFRRAYLRKQLEALPKALGVVEERTQTELDRAERGRVKASPAQIAFWKQRVKRLATAREELKSRVEGVLKKVQAGT